MDGWTDTKPLHKPCNDVDTVSLDRASQTVRVVAFEPLCQSRSLSRLVEHDILLRSRTGIPADVT